MANKYTQFWFIQSHSDPELYYKVSRRVQGDYACSCKHWIFRNYGQFDFRCKHIDDVVAGRFTYEAVGNVHRLLIDLEDAVQSARVGTFVSVRRIVDPLSPLEQAVVNQEIALASKKVKRMIVM